MNVSTLTDHRRPDRPVAPIASARPPQRILVIPREDARPYFYYEPGREEEEDDADAPPTAAPITTADGLRGRLKRVTRGIREAEHHAPVWLRSPIRWLKSKLPADERLLMGLRTAHTVALIHSTRMPEQDVLEAWSAYLDSRFRSRIGWLVFYAVVLVPSVMLAVLPGPNVVGFWVTYRLIAHGIALYGISRARRGAIAIATRASAMLDGPIVTDRKETERVQRHFGLLGFKGRFRRERILNRLRRRRQRQAAEAAPASPIDEPER